jgi:hypothetical protein
VPADLFGPENQVPPVRLTMYHRKQHTKSVEWQHVEVQYLNNSREIRDADSARVKFSPRGHALRP